MVELLIAYMLTGPFGNVPFTVSERDGGQALVEVMRSPPISILFSKDMEVLEVNGVQEDCETEDKDTVL